MEAANLAMNLGLSKFFQALRSRKQETKEALDKAQAEASKLTEDNKALSESFEKLKAKLAEAEKQLKQGGGK
jgi:predicted nuclease with TOPRIM domain